MARLITTNTTDEARAQIDELWAELMKMEPDVVAVAKKLALVSLGLLRQVDELRVELAQLKED